MTKEPTHKEQEEFWDIFGNHARARTDLTHYVPTTVYVCGEQEAKELPEHLQEELVVAYSPLPFGEDLESAEEDSFMPSAEDMFDTDEERRAYNDAAIAVADALYWEKRLASFMTKHPGKSFRVFRPEDIERAWVCPHKPSEENA